MPIGYDNKPNLDNRQFEQCTGDTLNLYGHTIIGGACGTIDSFNGYRVSGQTIFGTGSGINAVQIGNTAISRGAGSTVIGSGSCTTGATSIIVGHNSYAQCDESLVVGNNNRSCSVGGNIIGGANNILGSSNPCSTLLGVCNCCNLSGYNCYVIVPNLAILNTTGSGNYLCLNPSTKKVELTTAGGSGGITGATNGLCRYNSTNVCLGGYITGNTNIYIGTNDCLGIGYNTSAPNAYGGRIQITTNSTDANNYVDINTKFTTTCSNIHVISTGITLSSNASGFKGAVYGADYSANFTARSLIDKGYFAAHSGGTGGSGVTGATNLGNGNGTIYTNTSACKLNLKTLSGGTNVTLTCNGNYIGINATGGGGSGIGWSNLTGGSTVAGCGTLASGNTLLCNTFYGVQAGASTTGDANVAVGDRTLFTNSTGCGNIAIGHEALLANTIGYINTAIGYQALCSNINGFGNLANGMWALAKNTCGADNIANGYFAGYANINGNCNIANGSYSLRCNTSGCENIAIGFQSLHDNITGSSNIAIGYCAGFAELGSNKLYIANSGAIHPLIYGDFATKCIKIHGQLAVTGVTNGGSATQGLVWDTGSTLIKQVPIINEWVGAITELCYAGQKFSYPTQTIMKTDVGTCTTVPNYILLQNIDLKVVACTPIFTIPAGKVVLFNRAKLIFLCDADPTGFKVSIGNMFCGTPSLSYANLVSLTQIADVLKNCTYDLTPLQQGADVNDGSIIYFNVQSGSTSLCALSAHLLIESFLY